MSSVGCSAADDLRAEKVYILETQNTWASRTQSNTNSSGDLLQAVLPIFRDRGFNYAVEISTSKGSVVFSASVFSKFEKHESRRSQQKAWLSVKLGFHEDQLKESSKGQIDYDRIAFHTKFITKPLLILCNANKMEVQ